MLGGDLLGKNAVCVQNLFNLGRFQCSEVFNLGGFTVLIYLLVFECIC